MDRRGGAGRPVRRVKLMADHGAFPLWAVPDGGAPVTDDPWVGGLAPHELPLSAPLVAELRGWADTYERLLRPTFAWPSEQVKVAFVEEGRRLLALVRAELGSGYEVCYFDEITGRVEDD